MSAGGVRMEWGVCDGGPGVHIVPLWERGHELDGPDCFCDPDVAWIDPDTEIPFPNGPLVSHRCESERAGGPPCP